MAGIVYPNLAQSLLPAMQMERWGQYNALSMAREQRLQQQQDEETAAQQYLPQALQGDQNAISHLPPRMMMQIAPMLDRLDQNQRTKLKEAADWQTQAAMGVLNAPPDQRAAAYQTALDEGKARGYDLSRMPGQYSPAVDGLLQYHINRAIPVSEYIKLQQNQPTAMGPAAGGAAPTPGAPDLLAKGQPVVDRLVNVHGFSPVAAAGIAGNLAQESGFNPGYGFTQPPGMGGAVGIAQWDSQRAQGLAQFAKAQGTSPADLNTQVDYLVNEMKSGDMGAQRAYAMLQQAKTPEDAATAMMHFERPKGYTPANPQGGLGYAQRVQYAQQFAGAGGQPPQSAAPSPQGPQPGMPQVDPLGQFRVMQLPPGARFVGDRGVPITKDGNALIEMIPGRVESRTWMPMPKPADMPLGMATGPGGLPAEVQIPQGDSGQVAPGIFTGSQRNEAYLATLPPAMQPFVKAYADGRMPVPSQAAMRNPQMIQLMEATHNYDNSFDATNYAARANLRKSLTGGKDFDNIIAPANKFLNHAAGLTDATDKLPLGDSLIDRNGGNQFRLLQIDRAGTADERANLTNWQTKKEAVLEEFTKFMGGAGKLTDKARAAYDMMQNATTPGQISGALSAMTDLMNGQLDPYVQQAQTILGNTNAMPGDLLNSNSRQALGKIQAWDNKIRHPQGAQAPPASAAPSPQGQTAPPQAAAPAAPAAPPGGNFIGNTPDGRPVYLMPNGSKVVPQ